MSDLDDDLEFFGLTPGQLDDEPDLGQEEMGGRTMVIQVTDERLAVCLFSVGIPLREDPPYVSVDMGPPGKPNIRTVYHFEPATPDGKTKTSDLVRAWSKDLEFIEKNPLHPFTIAMCVMKNMREFREHHQERGKPMVAFRAQVDGKWMNQLVVRGSRKHQAALKRGLKQVVLKPRGVKKRGSNRQKPKRRKR